MFVDLRVLSECIAPCIPADAVVLDVGGGDGDPLNHLLALRPDIRVTMIDPSERLGGLLEQRFLDRVEIRRGTTIRQYAESMAGPPDCVLVSDVVHHVPPADRAAFFSDLKDLIGECPVRVIVKDVEPGHLRALLGLLADRFITGDRHASLISRTELERLVREAFGCVSTVETDVYLRDSPNYALVFTRTGR